MKYLSIDVETSGLDPNKHQMIEFAAVMEDTEKDIPIDELPRFRALILQPSGDYNLNTYCVQMHQVLFKEIDKHSKALNSVTPYRGMDWNGKYNWAYDANLNWDGSTDGYSNVKSVMVNILAYPDSFMDQFKLWLGNVEYSGNILPAGKNFYAFDWNFIKPFAQKAGVRFHHRSLDPAPLFVLPTDPTTPSLAECAQRAGMEFSGGGHHTALADAEMVIKLFRYGWKKLWTK